MDESPNPTPTPILRSCKGSDRNVTAIIPASTSTCQQSSQPHFLYPPRTTSEHRSLPMSYKLLSPPLSPPPFLHTSHSLKTFKVPRHGQKEALKAWSQGGRPVGKIKEAPKLSYHRKNGFQSVCSQFRTENRRILPFFLSTSVKKKVFRNWIKFRNRIKSWQESSEGKRSLLPGLLIRVQSRKLDGEGRELTSENCSLTPRCVPWHMHSPFHAKLIWFVKYIELLLHHTFKDIKDHGEANVEERGAK